MTIYGVLAETQCLTPPTKGVASETPALPRPRRAWFLKLLSFPTLICPYRMFLLELFVMPRQHWAWFLKFLLFPTPIGPYMNSRGPDSQLTHEHFPCNLRVINAIAFKKCSTNWALTSLDDVMVASTMWWFSLLSVLYDICLLFSQTNFTLGAWDTLSLKHAFTEKLENVHDHITFKQHS